MRQSIKQELEAEFEAVGDHRFSEWAVATYELDHCTARAASAT